MELSGITDSSIRRTAYQPVEQTAPQQPRDEQSQAVNRTKAADKNTANKEGVTDRVTLSGKSLEDPQVKAVAEKMKAIEEKVKAHEAAHKSAGGNLAGPASFSYTQGPDGRSYITGGEVQINISTGKTPEETIARMQQVIRAALAPADPSGQDRAVAAQAASQIAQAQQQKNQEESAAKTEPTALEEPKNTSSAALQNSGADRDTTEQGIASQARKAYASQTMPHSQSAQDRFSTSSSKPGSLSSFA